MFSCMKMPGERHGDLGTHKNKTEKFYPMPWCHGVRGRNWKQWVSMFDAFFRDPKALRDSQTFKIKGLSAWSRDKTSLSCCWRHRAGWGTHIKTEILKRKGKGSPTLWACVPPTPLCPAVCVVCTFCSSDRKDTASSSTLKNGGSWH